MQKMSKDKHFEFLSNAASLSVDVILYRGESANKEALFLKRAEQPAKGMLYPVGGNIRKGEFAHQALLRKVREETGLNAQIERYFGTYETIYPVAQSPTVVGGLHTVNLAFIARVVGNDKVELDPTSTGYNWINEKETGILPHYSRVLVLDSGIFRNVNPEIFHRSLDYRIISEI